MLRITLAADRALRGLLGRRTRRAAGLLEYMLVALVSVMVFMIVYYLFDEQINALADQIRDKITSTTS